MIASKSRHFGIWLSCLTMILKLKIWSDQCNDHNDFQHQIPCTDLDSNNSIHLCSGLCFPSLRLMGLDSYWLNYLLELIKTVVHAWDPLFFLRGGGGGGWGWGGDLGSVQTGGEAGWEIMGLSKHEVGWGGDCVSVQTRGGAERERETIGPYWEVEGKGKNRPWLG